jgi:hypothetical protein
MRFYICVSKFCRGKNSCFSFLKGGMGIEGYKNNPGAGKTSKTRNFKVWRTIHGSVGQVALSLLGGWLQGFVFFVSVFKRGSKWRVEEGLWMNEWLNERDIWQWRLSWQQILPWGVDRTIKLLKVLSYNFSKSLPGTHSPSTHKYENWSAVFNSAFSIIKIW